jgi:hypothetical protein
MLMQIGDIMLIGSKLETDRYDKKVQFHKPLCWAKEARQFISKV